jgi:2-polyprenyl-3-methyl-5-hydroxy-6-metoxy-1,4-benzoquinol methylase
MMLQPRQLDRADNAGAKVVDAQLDDTGERMIPEFHLGRLIYAEHLVRYQVALDLVRGKTVLDIASGSGYGSAMLATTAAHVHGVDISEEAVEYARANFRRDNVDFTVGSATDIPLADDSVDVVVTFETIEHVDDYLKFLSEIGRVLKSDGIAIISTPNDLEFAEGNHFHLHEFERDELLELVHRQFTYVDEYYQATWKYVAIGTLDQLADDRPDHETLNLAPLKDEQLLYFYFVCSNRKITEKISALAALGEHFSDRDVSELHHRIGGLQVDNSELNQHVQNMSAELRDIKASRSFRFFQRVARVRKRLHL